MTERTTELRSCAPRQTQLATITTQSATGHATPSATPSLKSLALKVLTRNSQRNCTATDAVAACNSGTTAAVAGCTRMGAQPATTNHEPMPLDEHGLPYQPCQCGGSSFWRPLGGEWRCQSCAPYTGILQSGAMTCTLPSSGLRVLDARGGK